MISQSIHPVGGKKIHLGFDYNGVIASRPFSTGVSWQLIA
jgi:hypothetical protein